MAEQQEPHSLASTFPNPPPFWKDFTPENIGRIESLRRLHNASGNNGSASKGADGAASVRIANLPEELVRLQPPPEPADGKWTVFGDRYMLDDKLPTLEEQGIENLPATNPSHSASKDTNHYDRALELKRLAKSLLLNFLELAGTLSTSPASAEAKIGDLRTLFINMHHILNEYRPHQARESAIEMMQDHLDRTRTETAAIRTQVDKARRVLEGLGSLNIVGDAGAAGNSGGGDDDGAGATAGDKTTEEEEREAIRLEREAATWAATDALLT